MEQQNVHGDWSTLIVLDACRFDSFQTVAEKVGLQGRLRKVWSIADTTIPWYKKNWSSRYPDISILSSNPFVFWPEYGYHKRFGEAHKLWRPKVGDSYIDARDSLDMAVQLIEKSEWNRFLIHLMPPHLPFLSAEGLAFLREIGYPDPVQGTRLCEAITAYGREHGWMELRGYYEDSLEIALRMLQRYKQVFQGEVVITSDHGELIGEHDHYFHGGEGTMYPVTPALHEVPWLQWRTSS